MPQDPLSAILSLIEPRTIYAGGLAASGDWAVRFPAPDKIKFFVVAHGRASIAVDGYGPPLELEAGDVLIYSAGARFTLASDLSVPAIAAETLYQSRKGEIATIGAGDTFLQFGSHLDIDRHGNRMLIENLPPVIHLKHDRPGASQLQWLITELVREMGSRAAGAEAFRSGLAHLLFVQALRIYLAEADSGHIGMLRAAGDPRLAPAIELMHAEPARNWHLPELARASGMSRTAFAIHFKAVAGMGPMAYLAEWRMRLAERMLQKEGETVASVAGAVGYASEAAFSTAFKRVLGRSPRRQIPPRLAAE